MIKPHVINIRVQESDTGSLRFTFPSTYSLANKTVEVVVRDKSDVLVLELNDGNGRVAIAGQDIICQILTNDTTGKVGAHRYALVALEGGTIRETLCKGFFTIEK